MVAVNEEKLINRNLISLKIVVISSFIGFASVHLLNTTLPFYLGLNFEEYRLITIITPLISIIGPLIVGPLADHLAGKNASNYGRCLRILTAICLIISAILYICMFAIPKVQRQVQQRPLVNFACNSDGGIILQQRCIEEHSCHSWDKKHGDLILTNCSYACQDHHNLSQFEKFELPLILPQNSESVFAGGNDDYSEEVTVNGPSTPPPASYYTRSTRTVIPFEIKAEPPHLCEKRTKKENVEYVAECHVYTHHAENLKIDVTLQGVKNDKNDTDEWCSYPVGRLQCNVRQQVANFMATYTKLRYCKPVIHCDLIDPYVSKSSVLADTICMKIEGDVDLTVTTYFIIRPIASIFLLAALSLLNTAIVIAIRETSTGRGEICRQYVWGALAWTILIPSLVLYKEDIYNIHIQNDEFFINMKDYLIVLLVIIGFSFGIAACFLIFVSQMPLSPPEWWWHTKTGMLVYPMSAIRKYFPEMLALCFITLVLGIFWGSIHSYTAWVYKDWYGISYTGCIFLLFLFFNVDKFIEYCSHSNILITVFAMYIIRFTGLQLNDDDNTLTILMEALEPLYVTIGLITVMLYMRHIIERKFTATGQAVIVALHFGLGKFLGALIGLEKDERYPDKSGYMYHYLAVFACILAFVYFILYNLILAPRCAAKAQPAPQISNFSPSNSGGGSNGAPQTNTSNGNYTPLRVYHNERGKKGQFRY